jgi:hypothetical protein
MSARKLGTLLGSAELKPLLEKTRRLAGLQERYVASIPPPLARTSRVAGYRSGTLILAADNAAAATRLRQLTPRLLKRLNELEPQVTAIRIRVQPVNRQTLPSPQREGLPADALRHFQALAHGLANPVLKAAVETLVRHHRKRR